MIELTDQQVQALESPEATPPRLVNPRTKETFVLLRVEEYEHLTEEYDDSPWTRNKLAPGIAWEAGKTHRVGGNGRVRRGPGEAMNPGDVNPGRFPHPSGLRGKKRPAVVVQSDAYTGRAAR